MFVPNPMRCFNCNKFGHTSQRCKVAAKCPVAEKISMMVNVRDPSCVLIAMVLTLHRLKDCPVWQKEKETQRVRVEKRISFPEARHWLKPRCRLWSLEVRPMPLPLPPKESKSVECQTSLTGFFCLFFFLFVFLFVCFQNVHLGRLSLTCVLLADPGSVSTGTQASSGKLGTVSADARLPCEPAKCSSETDRGLADPPKRPLRVPPVPTKWHLRVLRLPPKAHLRVQQVP